MAFSALQFFGTAARWCRAVIIAAGVCVGSTEWLAAQGNSSLPDIDIEFAETQLTLASAVEDNELLRRQLLAVRQSIGSLTESLAIANTEAEVFRRQYMALQLKMEALGLDSVGTDKSKLEKRLLKAVQDLQIVQEEKEKLSDQLIGLNEALIRYLRTAQSTDAQARMDLETQVREANKTLGIMPESVFEGVAVASSLTDGMVISIKGDLSLVVANLGSLHGVKIGMPFEVWRAEKHIGIVRVVDVREKISGAVIQDLLEGIAQMKVGDRLRVETSNF